MAELASRLGHSDLPLRTPPPLQDRTIHADARALRRRGQSSASSRIGIRILRGEHTYVVFLPGGDAAVRRDLSPCRRRRGGEYVGLQEGREFGRYHSMLGMLYRRNRFAPPDDGKRPEGGFMRRNV
jgi:hypothetical protein